MTLKIEGMMCTHCEAHVRDALLGVCGVVSAVVDHKSGCAVIDGTSDAKALVSAVENAGYKVIFIDSN